MELTEWAEEAHAHKCKCGYAWAHDPIKLCGGYAEKNGTKAKHTNMCDSVGGFVLSMFVFAGFEEAYDRAHHCPKCGEYVTECTADVTPAEIWTGDEHLPWVEPIKA